MIQKIKNIFPIIWFIGKKKLINNEMKETKTAPIIDDKENLQIILWWAILFAKNDPKI